MNTTKCPVCYGEGCEFCNFKGELDATLTVWGHLQDAPLKKHYFPSINFATYWGSFLEKLGRRVIRETLPNEFYNGLFPDVEIISSDTSGPTKRGRALNRKKGINITLDYVVILHCRRGPDEHEKNAVLFEIKSSVSPISASHIRKWRDLIANPGNHIKKCRKIRIFIMWVHGLDYESRNIFYTLKEFDPSEIPDHFHDSGGAGGGI